MIALADVTLLVVDDDAFTRRVVARTLSKLGAGRVEEAADGSAALELAMRDPPGIVFCDVHMKPMDGLTFVLSLRNLGGIADLSGVKVVMMTSDERPEVSVVADQLKCDAFLVKPITVDKVRSTLAWIGVTV